MAIEIKRFKLEDGREGFYAPLGNGLIKMLFDDGSMAIVMGEPPEDEEDQTNDHQEEEG